MTTRHPTRALTTFAWLVLTFMLLTILWGAYVRISGSGAGCGKHWPFCNGQLIPHNPRLQTIIEFAHRSMSGFLTTLIVALASWTFYSTPPRHPARRAVVWVVVLLLTEALLGAALVLGGWVDTNASSMRVLMQCVHFTNTMLLVAALTLTAWRLRSDDPPARLTPLALAALFFTLLAGATGSVAALADTLFPSPTLSAALAADFNAAAPLMVRTRWIHPASACIALVLIAMLCLRRRSRLTRLLAVLLAAQFVLGLADVLLLAPAWLQVLHLLGADLFWITLVIAATDVANSKGDALASPSPPLRGRHPASTPHL